MVRKANKSLKAWVTFVKKVQKEEGLSYSDAMKRSKVRKDSGEKWMSGGGVADSATPINPPGTHADMKIPADVNAKPVISDSLVSNQGGSSTSTTAVLGAKGGSKKQQNTSKKQQKTSKKQQGGRRKTCSKK
uniref:Uncharacterized protein n=1 Tax=viral metagenome TaxID=1070528 RepID=A0A6C0K0T3_9ZZZZ